MRGIQEWQVFLCYLKRFFWNWSIKMKWHITNMQSMRGNQDYTYIAWFIECYTRQWRHNPVSYKIGYIASYTTFFCYMTCYKAWYRAGHLTIFWLYNRLYYTDIQKAKYQVIGIYVPREPRLLNLFVSYITYSYRLFGDVGSYAINGYVVRTQLCWGFWNARNARNSNRNARNRLLECEE